MCDEGLVHYEGAGSRAYVADPLVCINHALTPSPALPAMEFWLTEPGEPCHTPDEFVKAKISMKQCMDVLQDLTGKAVNVDGEGMTFRDGPFQGKKL